MSVAMRWVAATGLALLAWPTAAESPKPAAPTEEEIRRAVKDLADERFAVRQRAVKLLWAAGEAAEKHLRAAANDPDPEVVRQARTLLDRIAYRIDPDTPAEVVALLQRFRAAAGDTPEQSQVVRDLLRLGGKAHMQLLRLLDAVEDRPRRLILDEFAYDDWRVLSALIADGQEAVVEQLLERALAAQNEAIVPHYAAYQALTRRLDVTIAELRPRVDKTGRAFDARVLLALCRLKGDAEGALDAARKAQLPVWARRTLTDMGRWAELLAELPPPRPGLTQINDLGYLAAYQRLAGRTAEFEATVGLIEQYAAEPSGPRNNRPWHAAKVLLINEKPAAAHALLRRHGQHAVLAEILAGQGRYREALELSEQAAKAESGAKYAARAGHIDLLLRVGHAAKAREGLGKLAGDMGDSSEPGWLDRWSAFQVRLGERKEVERRLAQRLERNDGSSLTASFAALYPRLDGHAELLLELLRQKHPQDETAEQLARLALVDEGRMPPAELVGLLTSSVPVHRHTNQPKYEAVARLVALLELPDVAVALLAQPGWEKAPAEAVLLLADTLAGAGRWPAAAAAYRKAWELDKGAALPLFLHAQALRAMNANDPRAGELVERSHRVPLGSDSRRYEFHLALRDRGHADDSLRELTLCAALLPGGLATLGNAQDHLARQLAARGEFNAAATIHERNVLRVIPINSGFRSPTAYARVTADVHILRARGLLAAGKLDEALREAGKAEELCPGDLDIAIRLVPALEKAGEKRAADELFARVAAPWRKACEEFPDCAAAHNQLAWLGARCRRDLGGALAHARRATELAPLTAAYHDTLAEALFQTGQRQAAVDAMKKCLKLPNTNPGFYRRQLVRFRTGQPSDEPGEE